MIQQEELHIKQFTTGVTFFIFSDTIYNQLPENPDQYEGPFPSYIVFNLQNEIYSLNYFTGNTIWTRNDNNNYIPIGEIGWNYQTGYTLVKTIASDLSQENIDNMSNLMLSRLSDPTRPGTPPSASAATNYVFYRKKPIDDFYVDLKLERSYNSLDTLKINNNLVNTFPEQNSPTGVVFGRLMAIQKIKGENGENLRIPLRNVPIGIFNPSDEFPNAFSTDDNGDRLTLNIKESAVPNDYFDSVSYSVDYNNYLRSAESFSAVPAQYKYITKTNENGEFIIYDVPVGEQLAIFEVDLFKQGLTKDEIALNFFPFPPTQEPNIDTLPSFVFKQFPIDVVPAWGLGQTGYTSLDININLDLRKWTTYILPPVTYSSQKLNETTARNSSRSLKVDIRDMTSPNFSKRPIEIVQIPNDLDRDIGAPYLWFNEFSQKKTSIQFSEFGCHVFKLPGNIYDSSAYRTNKDGVPTLNKGVWLASYQFNIYIDKIYSQRATGAAYYQTTQGKFIRSHYHLNYTEGNLLDGSVEEASAQIGVFPYEKPWSSTYPVPYSIPRKPTQLRVLWGPDRLLYPGTSSYYVEEPTYSDGDLVGNTAYGSIGDVGGFGVQFFGSTWFYNRIANVATRSYMYKYESGVSKTETYANGYEPHWDATNNPYSYNDFPFAGISKVVGGEKYQRLECGYGYFVRPQGWSRIVRADWAADVPKDLSALAGYGSADSPGPSVAQSGFLDGWFYRKPYPLTIYNIDNQNFALHLGSANKIKEGTLDFYRIVESGPNENGEFTNIASVETFFVPTYVRLNIEGAFLCYNIKIKNTGEIPVSIKNTLRGTVQVDNFDTIEYYKPGETFTLQMGSTFTLADSPASGCFPEQPPSNFDLYFYDGSSNMRKIADSYANDDIWVRDTVSFTSLLLPGNANASEDNQNIFVTAKYEVSALYYRRYNSSVNIIVSNPLSPLSGATQTISTVGGNAIGYDSEAAIAANRSFSQDYANYESKSVRSDTQLVPITNIVATDVNGYPISYYIKTATLLGTATFGGENLYYVRTETDGGPRGLIHEGIGKYLFYDSENYWEDPDLNLYALKIEGPTNNLWGSFTDDSGASYGYGRRK